MKSLIYALLFTSSVALAQVSTPAAGPLKRHYHDGETITYRMAATNDGRHYTADATGVVKQMADGTYVVPFRWTNLTSDGKAVELAPAMIDFREPLSLDPGWTPSMPDLSKVDPRLIGPVTDLMTFYVDDWLANKVGVLQKAGDHFFMPNPQASSWADGVHVLVGKSHIDFDLTLKSVDEATHTALLVVHHVPPAHPNIEFPAAWMQAAADRPTNWIQVSKTNEGKYEAAVGKETFDVSITVSTVDGKILSATMDNPVVMSGRSCEDAALTKCGEPQQHTIHRQVEIVLQH